MPETSIFRPADYPNQLGLLDVSAQHILEQVEGIRLSFLNVHNWKVERGIRFPEFIKAFYNFIYQNHGIPSQEEYFQFYLNVNRAFFAQNNFGQDIILGLKARVYRTYPSLVRDIYFNKLLEENNHGYEILYNLNLDLERDIDTMLIKDGKYWAACLYTQTRRANVARKWKENRHIRFDNVEYAEFPVVFTDDRKVGDFFLYGEPELQTLFNHIEQ